MQHFLKKCFIPKAYSSHPPAYLLLIAGDVPYSSTVRVRDIQQPLAVSAQNINLVSKFYFLTFLFHSLAHGKPDHMQCLINYLFIIFL